ncbi:SRPBCC family protein [Gordonia sp. NPDC003376]
MAYDLEPFDLDFFDNAPISFRIDVNIPVTPQRAWAELTRPGTLDWCKAIKSITFTSSAPFGVGTTRRAELSPGYVALSEEFFDWTEDPATGIYHNAFRVKSVNVPGIRRFGEYTEIGPSEVGSRLVWVFALELGSSSWPVTAISNPMSTPVFRSIESDTLRHFAHLTPQA